ncbi:phosphatase PAP2 family protein [Xanthobacteraceae bacterium A53D]
MSDAVVTPPAPRRHRLAEDAKAAVGGLFGALAYLRRHPVRGVSPRLPMDGAVELICLFVLVGGVVAASMILLDPLILGLRVRLNHEFVQFFERVTELGLGSVVLWPLGIALLVLLGSMPHLVPVRRAVAAALVARIGYVFVSVVGASLTILVVKYIIGRARPGESLMLSMHNVPNAHLTFEVFRLKASYASFPSGHTAVIFALAVALAMLFPRARWWLVALAVLVAASRVVLGSHFPSDVIAAAAFSTAFTLWMTRVFAARRIVFSVAADGRVSPMPGPSMRRFMALFSPLHRSSGSQASGSQEARP